MQSTSYWATVSARDYLSLAALVFMLTDYIATIRSEYKYIWRWKAPWWSTKGLYFLARYLGIITQLVNYSLVQVYLNRGPVKPYHCKIWFTFLSSSFAILFAAFDAVLLIRVYALYRRNFKIYVLVIPLMLQYILPFLIVTRNALRLDSFSYHCDVNGVPIEVGIVGGTTIMAHTPLWFATFWKRKQAGSAEIVKLVVHEGDWTFGLLILYMAGILSYCIATRSGNPFIIFVWPVVVFSIISCRMIIHMCALNPPGLRQESTLDSPSIAFTTFIDTQFTNDEVEMDRPVIML